MRRFARILRRGMPALKWIRIAAYAFGVTALLAWLSVPPVLKWAVEVRGSAALGRRLSVGKAGFDPFRLEARLDGLSLAEADGEREWIGIEHARLNFSLASLWQRALVLDGISLEGPRVRVVREQAGRYNFSDLAGRFATQPGESPSTPLRFSIGKVEVNGGVLDYDDRARSVSHRIDAFRLSLPFISNLPDRHPIDISPVLDARIDGSSFHLKGALNPFGAPRQASLELGFDTLDLTRYLPYFKGLLPLDLRKASATSGLHLVWSEGRAGLPDSLALSGKLSLAGVDIRDKADAPLLGFDALDIDIERFEPLASPLVADFRSIVLRAPKLELHRSGDGQLNLARVFAPHDSSAARTPSASARAAPPQLRVQRFDLAQGKLRWQDDAVPGGYRLTLDDIGLAIQRLDTGSDAPAALKLRAHGENGERLALDAALGVRTLRLGGEIQADGVQLENLGPYYQSAIGRARLAGTASLTGRVAADLSREASGLRLDALTLALKDFRLHDRKTREPLLSIPGFSLEAASLDLAQQTLELGRLRAEGGRLGIERGRDGSINLLDVLRDAAGAEGRQVIVRAGEALRAAPAQLTPIHALPAAQRTRERPKEWQLALTEGALRDWQLTLTDRSGLEPVSVTFGGLGLKLEGWSSLPGRQAKLALDTRVNERGRLQADGSFAGSPLQAALNLRLQAVDLIAAQPYVDDLYKILITRGQLSANGRLSVDTGAAGTPELGFAGSFAIDNFNALDRLNQTDFMRWKHFGASGLRFQTRPLTVVSSELRLDDFFTRLILDEKGRLNVRELGAGEDAATGGAAAAAAGGAGTATLRVGPPPSPPPRVEIGRVLLREGSVIYTDRLVKPNYEARLLALNGELKNFSSDPAIIATLSARASLDGAAPVSVDGRLNPFRQDRMLDIQAQVRDVDLTSASTYAARYVGYGIEKGKLSMDVQYEVADRLLSARNSIRLDQLSFGKPVESPHATSLPVLFAVSLLKDRRGVIDLNLPISGSLDDPQFSLASVVLRVFRNLISKAATSPFALLGSAFGGDPETLSFVSFEPGSRRLGEREREKLAGLAKALGERPALNLELAARTDPAADATALKRARLRSAMQAMKADQPARSAAEEDDDRFPAITPEAYPALLRRVYEQTRIDARPRNAFGMLRAVPVEEMERLLLGSYVISSEDLQALARARAQTVRRWLLEEGGVSSGRVFLRRDEDTEGAERSAEARVDFLLR